jgi:thiol-disulfide isomerase/thioredoxin
MKRARLIAICTVGLSLSVILVFGVRDIRQFRAREIETPAAATAGKEIPTIRFVKDPQPAPDFTVTDLDGQPISSAALRGKVVFVNFWATWCGPCQEEIPDLVRLQQKYAGRFVVVGLSQDDAPAKVKEFVRAMKINYPVAMSQASLEAKFGGVFGLPTSFVLDTEGRIVQKHIGLRNPQLYEMEIRALLNLPVNAKVEQFQDTGQVMLANAKDATEYPGVDLSKLNPEQRKAVQRQLNEKQCACGCGLTVAQCLVNDSSCSVSKGMADLVVQGLLTGKPYLASEGAKP